MDLIIFFLPLLILSLATAGLGKLIMVVIAPGEIFGGWQRVLSKIKNEFWYKSLGGCATCTRQRVAEIVFAGFVLMWNEMFGAWFYHLFPLWLNIVLSIGTYLLFCGLVIYFGSMIEYEKKKVEAIEKEYPDEKIIRNEL